MMTSKEVIQEARGVEGADRHVQAPALVRQKRDPQRIRVDQRGHNFRVDAESENGNEDKML